MHVLTNNTALILSFRNTKALSSSLISDSTLMITIVSTLTLVTVIFQVLSRIIFETLIRNTKLTHFVWVLPFQRIGLLLLLRVIVWIYCLKYMVVLTRLHKVHVIIWCFLIWRINKWVVFVTFQSVLESLEKGQFFKKGVRDVYDSNVKSFVLALRADVTCFLSQTLVESLRNVKCCFVVCTIV